MAWSSVAEVEKGVLGTPSQQVPVPLQKVVFQQFQSGHGYEKSAGTGTMSDDTSDFVVGTQSLKVVTKGDESQTHVRKKSVGPYDFSGCDLRITFKVEGLAHVEAFEIFLSSDNLSTNNVHYSISTPVQPYIADGEWASVTISWGDLINNFPPGAISRNKVNFIEFRCEDDGKAPVTFHVNEVAGAPETTSGRLSIVFDDGWESTYTRARPYLDRYGYRADTVANHNAGYGNLENSVVEAELQGIKRWLIENGFKRRDLFAWPLGSFTASQMPIARRFFGAVRGTTGGRGGSLGPQETFPPADVGRLRTWTIGNTNTAAEVETALNQCINYDSWLILSFHQIVASGAKSGTETNESVFKEIIDKIAASGIEVQTMAEVLEG